MNNSDLLKELRIDRSAPPPVASRRPLWIALAVAAGVVVLALAGWALLGRDDAVEVKTATVTAMGSGDGSATVLDATGYVVARRMATVSAKITGKVREVLIGFRLPDEWVTSIPGARTARLSLSGRNLFTFTRYSGLDPEVSNFGNQAIARNIDVAPFPPSRSFWFTVDVGF